MRVIICLLIDLYEKMHVIVQPIYKFYWHTIDALWLQSFFMISAHCFYHDNLV